MSACNGTYPVSDVSGTPSIWDATPGTPVHIRTLEQAECALASWRTRLEYLRAGSLAPEPPTAAQIHRFTSYLWASVQPERTPSSAMWSLAPFEPRNNEARVDFVYLPTYVALAWMSLVLRRHRAAFPNAHHLDGVLHDGLKAIRRKRLEGHGFDSDTHTLEAVEILALGEVFAHVRNTPDLARLMHKWLAEIEDNLLNRMPLVATWGTTDHFERRRALALLRGADEDDSMVVPALIARRRKTLLDDLVTRFCDTLGHGVGECDTTRLSDELDMLIPQLETQLEKERPKYSVFGRRRKVRTPAYQLTWRPDMEALVQSVAANLQVPPWAWPIDRWKLADAAWSGRPAPLVRWLNHHYGSTHELAGARCHLSFEIATMPDPAFDTRVAVPMAARGALRRSSATPPALWVYAQEV